MEDAQTALSPPPPGGEGWGEGDARRASGVGAAAEASCGRHPLPSRAAPWPPSPPGGGGAVAELQALVQEAAARRTPLMIRAGGSKAFYGRHVQGEPLDVRSHAGIVSYEPSELVVTARCGTPLVELENLLAQHPILESKQP